MNFYNQNDIPKHKVFLSFHHADDHFKKILEDEQSKYFDGFVSRSVGDGDIDTDLSTDRIYQILRDDFISDATVTIVLIGKDTWRRKYVDWEIGSSIRNTKNNPRNGLIGILLPTYHANFPYNMRPSDAKYTEDSTPYNPHTIPPRLYDNIECGFAKIYRWPSSPTDLKKWIHEAFQKRDGTTILPDNSRDRFHQNRPDSQTQWSN